MIDVFNKYPYHRMSDCGAQLCTAPPQMGGGKRRTRKTSRKLRKTKKGGCGCGIGGYRATKRNLKYLRLWKKGKSIGFTMRSSLKAKGLIPRANGTYRVSNKYH